ncbi:MAG TPA: hypothetical protein VGU67_06265 [Edaphobacter sp.]|nr:hypothetical protein [Edaphobacter sp.]
MLFPRLRCVTAASCAALIAFGCIPSAPAQTTAPYTFCYFAGSSAAQGSNVVFYFSDVFSYSPSSQTSIPSAFAQAMRQQGINISTVPICPETGTMQAISQAKQLMETQTLPAAQRQYAAAGKTLSVVETSWSYQGAAPSAAAPNSLASPAMPVANTAPGAGANVSPAQSMSASGKAIQQGAKQSVNSTVYGTESSAVGAINGSMNKAAGSVQNNINEGIGKMFRKKKAAAPVPQTVSAPLAPVAVMPSQANFAPAQPAGMIPPPSAFGPPATRPSIQDEGDGKHWILTTPGQNDARELVLLPGSKNAYLEESTGDKYIVMPSGDITHIPHKGIAK